MRQTDLVRAVVNAARAGQCGKAKRAFASVRSLRLPPRVLETLRLAVNRCTSYTFKGTPREDATGILKRARQAIKIGDCDRLDYIASLLDSSTRLRVPERTVTLLRARASRCHYQRGW